MALTVIHSVFLRETGSLVIIKGDWFAFKMTEILPLTVAVCYLVSTVKL